MPLYSLDDVAVRTPGPGRFWVAPNATVIGNVEIAEDASIWFGVVLVILLEIGLITPPVGINLFTIQGLVPGETTEIEVARGSLPFLGLLLFGIALLVAFPGIALWLPNLLYN